MVARHVHAHTPVAQLTRPEFASMIIDRCAIPPTEHINDLDALPNEGIATKKQVK